MPDRRFFCGLHLATAAGFAISQPLFDILRRFPTFLVSHRLESTEVMALTMGLGLGVPAVFFALGCFAGLLPRRLHAAIHLGSLSLLTLATALPVVHRTGAPAPVAIPIAVLLASAVVAVYVRTPRVRDFVGLLSLALIVFPLLFLSSRPVRTLAFRGAGAEISPLAVEGDIPVVLLIFDEFPVTSLMDHGRGVDSVRYPHFAELASHSHWFRNGSTVAAFTREAVPAILTGSFPEGNRIPHHEEYPQTLYTILGGSYDLNVFEPLTMLLPPELTGETNVEEPPGLLPDLAVVYLHVLLPPDLTSGLPSLAHGWGDFGDGGGETAPEGDRAHREAELATQASLLKKATRSRVDVILPYIDRISTMGPRTLHMMHVLLPHRPWRHAPSGRNYCRKEIPIPGLLEHRWSDEGRYAQLGWQRHLLQVSLADRLLGRVVRELRQASLYDQALIVVTADHGIGFWPSEFLRDLSGNAHPSDILDVPLFVKLPGQSTGEITDRHVRTIDILPTITEVLGLGRPVGIDGHSVFDQSTVPSAIKRARDREDPTYLELDADSDAKYATLDRKLDLFGSGETSIHAVGRHRELLGIRTAEIEPAPAGPWTIQTDANYFRHTNKDGKFGAVYVTGRVAGPDAGSLSVAVAVNGVIEAVAQAVPIEDLRSEFHMVLPEHSLVPGPVQIEFLLVDERGDSPRFVDGRCATIRLNQRPILPHYLAE